MAEAMLKSGEILLRSGCQVRTVEDTMVTLGNSFTESTACSSYVTLTGIIVGVATQTSEATKIARVEGIGHDLWAIGRTVALAHQCQQDPQPPEEVLRRLEAIENGPTHKPLTLAAANAVCTLGCCLFYGTTGPTWAVILCAALAGIVVYVTGQAASSLLPNPYAAIFVQALAATAFCVVFHGFVPAADLGSTLIPVLMLLVPGMTFTTALQDTLSGDYLSGNARLAVAILVGIAIAIGSAVVLYYTGVLAWRPS